MFRYLALNWDHRNPEQGALARRFLAAMKSAESWELVLEAPGLHAFVRGRKPGVTDAYRLDSSKGVVLGTLFRRGETGAIRVHDGLSGAEQERILQSRGQALVDRFWGRYVAFLRLAEGHCVLRDPLGGLPCFRLEHDGICIVFSWLEDALMLPGVAVPGVAWDRLAAHIAFVSLGDRETVLQRVTQVLPGERTALPPAPSKAALLWSATSFAAAPVDSPPNQAAAALKRTVATTVQAWAACYQRVLLRLSGGLDSTIVLSCLDAETVKTDVTCVNYHSPGSNSDERAYARFAALRMRRQLLERERDAGYRLERVLDVARTPLPPTYLGRLDTARTNARLAAELGVDAMFTGAGGDQVFFQFRDWSTAADYLWIRGLDKGFGRVALDAARLADLSIWRVMRLAMNSRLGYSRAAAEAPAHLALANRDALPGADQQDRFAHPAARAAASLPPAKRMHVQLLLAPTDTYDPYEKEAAPEIVNPLMSQPLYEHCLALPTYVLVAGGQPRGLARRAFAEDIPTQIATRHAKGGMEDHMASLLRHNLQFARGMLLDGQLVSRGLVDRRRLEAVLSGRPTSLAAHTTEIHIYLGIEAWLQRMSPRRSNSDPP